MAKGFVVGIPGGRSKWKLKKDVPGMCKSTMFFLNVFFVDSLKTYCFSKGLYSTIAGAETILLVVIDSYALTLRDVIKLGKPNRVISFFAELPL